MLAPKTSKTRDPGWQAIRPLFPNLGTHTREALQIFPQALEKVWPLSNSHRRRLPDDIRDLSAILTCQRASLRTPYWNTARFVSAYLYYFLPWNLLRLCRLLAGLHLPEPKADTAPLFIDAGAGPLSLTMALWLAHPQWRPLPLRVLALDSRRQPLLLGHKILLALADILAAPCWQVHTATSSIYDVDRQVRAYGENTHPWLLGCANVINEIAQEQKPARHCQTMEGETENMDFLERLLLRWQNMPGCPRMLLVEPGTRLGGSLIMNARKIAREMAYHILAPCTHNKKCPLLQDNEANFGKKQPAGWCHFTFAASDAPDWLLQLSAEARLRKSSLSMSLLLLQRSTTGCRHEEAGLPVRVLSQPFPVAYGASPARYGCASCGLCLLPNSRETPSGSLVYAAKPQIPALDAKSGAIILQPMPAAISRMDSTPGKGKKATVSHGHIQKKSGTNISGRRKGRCS